MTYIGAKAAPVVGEVGGGITGYATTSALCWLAPKITKASWNYIAKPAATTMYNITSKTTSLAVTGAYNVATAVMDTASYAANGVASSLSNLDATTSCAKLGNLLRLS